MNLLIQAKGVHKSYTIRGAVLHVLKGASLDVARGEAVAIVGPSGAGKSTLLHILGGLDQPDQGAILFNGQDLYAMSGRSRSAARAQQIGFVFQAYHLFPELDVLENAALPAMTGLGPARSYSEAYKHARTLLAAVGLADRIAHRPMELSGGEQQRLALARALMNDPEVILADEPTGNLDEATGGQVLNYVFGLTKERGHTLLVVTHNEAVANRCDRILRLADGTVAD